MARRGGQRVRRGGEGAGFALIAVLGAPYFLAHAIPLAGLAIVGVGLLLALALVSRPTDQGLNALCDAVRNAYNRAPGLWAAGWIWAVGLAVVGLVGGNSDREKEAERESAQAASMAAAEAQYRSHRTALESEERARVAAIDAAETRRVAEENAWSADQRAESAMEALRNPPNGFYAATQYAHRMLDPIPQEQRRSPVVRRAARTLRVAEERQRREERRAREMGRGLMCRDGTMSPGCMCHGPHRGCCSWHGGVAGCEQIGN